VKDPGETDIDCGGPTCKRCRDGQSCHCAADCETTICQGNVCMLCTNPAFTGCRGVFGPGFACNALTGRCDSTIPPPTR
jgi:hypothetical protein